MSQSVAVMCGSKQRKLMGEFRPSLKIPPRQAGNGAGGVGQQFPRNRRATLLDLLGGSVQVCKRRLDHSLSASLVVGLSR